VEEKFINLKKPKNIVFIGYHNKFDELVKINKSFRISTTIITSEDQNKKINKKNKNNYFIFKKLDQKFENLIKKKFNKEETLFISIASRWIISENQIKNLFNKNIINYHPSRLPIDTGGGDFSWKILRNDRIDCQIFHLMTKDIDSGTILCFEKSVIPKDVIIPEDFTKHVENKFVKFYKSFILKIEKNLNFFPEHTPKYLRKHYPRLSTEINGWIDWSLDSISLIRFINAFEEPFKGASTKILGKRVFLKKVQLHGGEIANHPFMSGLVSRHDEDWIVVCLGDQYSLLIEKVIDERGNNIIKKIKEGDRFYTPLKKISNSNAAKIKSRASGMQKISFSEE